MFFVFSCKIKDVASLDEVSDKVDGGMNAKRSIVLDHLMYNIERRKAKKKNDGELWIKDEYDDGRVEEA